MLKFRNHVQIGLAVASPLLALIVVFFSATGFNPVGTLWLVLCVAFVWAFGLLRSSAARDYLIRGRGHLVIQTICWLVVLAVLTTDWPLRVSFAVSRPELERLAVAINRGEPPKSPIRAGLFLVRDTGFNHKGWTCLWLDSNKNGRTGFAQGANIDTDTPYLSVGIPLGEGWALVVEE